jgi:hypothetical protein
MGDLDKSTEKKEPILIEEIEEIKELKTGDIILFHGNSWFDWSIEKVTGTPWSHIGIILKNPTFISPEMKGIYFWESGYETIPDPSTNKKPLGVRITKLEDVYNINKKDCKIYFRRILLDRQLKFNRIKEIYSLVKDKPYDVNIIDWICAALNLKIKRTDKRFWCSAFTGFIYCKLKLLNPDIDWTILRPCDFSSKYSKLKFNNCAFTDEILITDKNILKLCNTKTYN